MRTAATGLRWTRATTVATAATLVAVAAHLGAGGPAPSLPMLSFLVLALVVGLAPLLARPASRARIVLLTVGGQFVAHTTLALATTYDAASTATHATMGGATGGAHHAMGGPAAGGSVVARLVEHVLAPDLRMLLAHTAAAVVVGFWLAAGERAVWKLFSLIWRALVLPLLPLPSSTSPGPAAVPDVVATVLARIVAGSVVRRGPPRLLTV